MRRVGRTPESRALRETARRLADVCPVELGADIAITGSVARGLADRHSDIEVICWNPELPAGEARRQWLESAGARDINLYPFEDLDGTRWVEIGWGRYEQVVALVDAVLDARRVDHGALQLAATLFQALPLRSTGWLATWQERLSTYPDRLQRRVIERNIEAWSDLHQPLVRWTLASRGLLMPLAMRLLWDMQNLWAVLYAVNKAWEPDYKWPSAQALDLAVQPDRLPERLNRVFALTDPTESIQEAFQLILDVLALVPPSIEVSAARASVRRALETRGELA